ncbi:MAG: T9SS type A sorting domain-containing protein [Rhodothermales bacterium]|nr:T9SS type A sorting domain-containing protein [Rhodothermales bacterium]
MPYRLLVIASILVLVPASQAQDAVSLLSPTPRAPGHFGGAVAGIPDVDGDSRGDLLIGADWEGGLAGRVHIFSGSSGSLIQTLESPTPGGNGGFGSAVSDVPDLDGDGVFDIVVGTFSEGSSATGWGRAHVFSGASGTLIYTLMSPNPEGAGQSTPFFGGSVAGISDIDGDSRGDLLVGAASEADGNTGRAYVFSGSSGDTLRTLTSPNPESNGLFGFRVAGVPDTDGDGTTDILVAAHTEDAIATNAGRAYLFSGATGALLHTFQSPNPSSGGLFGREIEGVSDTDGDGRGDVLIGASGDVGSGRAYLFSGATGSLIYELESPNPPGAGGLFGQAVGVTPDLDGDGVADLIVGATGEFEASILTGRAYVFSGATGTLLNSLVSTNPKSSGSFGYSVAGVPDANGDGQGDILVGAVQEDGPSASTGRAYLFSGGMPVANESSPTLPVNSLDVYPNPVREEATIRLTLSLPETVTIKLHDVLGRQVTGLHSGPLTSGANAFQIDASELASGVYFLVASTSTEVITQRLIRVD